MLITGSGDSRIAIALALMALLGGVQHEVVLFAAIGLLLGGIDDLVIDGIYFIRQLWRRATIYRRHAPMTIATLPAPEDPAPLAIFIPIWQEVQVIGPMLRSTLERWGDQNYRIFVGIYQNDGGTLDALLPVAMGDPRVMIAVNERPGPTTKADNLNSLWRAMLRTEAVQGIRYKAVVLHDAEDIVHPDALRLLSRLTDRFDLVQLPVLPLQSQQSQWIAGHYCDEFAESHGKALAVREAVGAAVPSAGVGCAFARDALDRLVDADCGGPFDPGSLTEDYEMGLRIAEQGGTGIFVQMRDASGAPVCTREHFPETLDAAIRQKARWMMGISLSGWDRLGWHGGIAEHWMRLRDRRAALAALILFASYLGLLLAAVEGIAALILHHPVAPLTPLLTTLLWANGALVLWRATMRGLFVARAYGWRQGLMSVPRILVANMIAILAARRAIDSYMRLLRGAPLVWDKTTHRFPEGHIGSLV